MWNKSIVQEILKTDDTELMHFASSAQIHPHQGHRPSAHPFLTYAWNLVFSLPCPQASQGDAALQPPGNTAGQWTFKKNNFRPEEKGHGSIYQIYKHKVSDNHDLGCVLGLFSHSGYYFKHTTSVSYRLHRHDFEQTPGGGEGKGSLKCCTSWGSQWVRPNWVNEQQQLKETQFVWVEEY